jgi:hypothetical protein
MAMDPINCGLNPEYSNGYELVKDTGLIEL